MQNSFIFISNSFGGIKSFRDILLEELIRENINCTLIDQSNHKFNKTNHKINKKKFIFYKINVLYKIVQTIKIIKKLSILNKNKKSIFIFSNPIIFLLYVFFIKYFFKKYKIFFFIHSHITKQNFLLSLANYIVSFLFIFIDKIFYVSKFTKKWWENKYYFCKFANSSIQYNSVYLNKKIKIKSRSKLKIGFVGRLSNEKGLNKFLEIASANKNKYIFNVFSEEKLKIKSYQKKYIKFFYKKKISDIYKNLDLLLITSPIENCPFSVLEAKSFGIPTLVYLTKGGIYEIINNNYDGIIIKSPINNFELSKMINLIEKKYKFFSQNAFKNSKKYNAKIQLKKLIKEKLLK